MHMKCLRIICYKERSTIQWMKRTQLQLNLSPVKTKATQTWTCGCLLLECGTHSGVGVESASRGIEDRTASVSITSRACRKLGRCQRTARRFTTVAVDFAQFARIFIQLSVLDDVDRLLRDDQAPCRRPTRQQVSGNLLFFSISASFSYRLDRSFTLVCAFVQNSAVFGQRLKSQSSHQANVVDIPRSSETDENSRDPFGACLTCCSELRNGRPFSASPSNSVDRVTHAICSIVAPFKSLGTGQ